MYNFTPLVQLAFRSTFPSELKIISLRMGGTESFSVRTEQFTPSELIKESCGAVGKIEQEVKSEENNSNNSTGAINYY